MSGVARIRKPALLPVVAAAAAIAIRLAWLEQGTTRLNGDESVTVLMAQRILHGTQFLWFAHQKYMGTAEQYLAVPFVALLPPGALAFHGAQLVLIGITAALLSQCAIALGLSIGRSLAAVGFWAIGPYTNVFYGTQTMGAYATAQLLGVVGLLIALRYPTTARPRAAAVLFGFCCGFALYANMQAAFLLIPAAVWIIGSRRSVSRFLALATAGALVGAAPALYWAWVHGTGGNFLGFHHQTRLTTPASRAVNLLTRTLPAYVGVTWPSEAPAAAAVPWDVVPLALLVGLGAAAQRFSRDIVRVASFGSRLARPLALPLSCVIFAVVPVILVARSMFDGVGQYLFCLYPATALLLAAALPRRRALAGVAGCVTVGFLVVTLLISDRRALLYRAGNGVAGLRDPTYAEDRAVVRWLRDRHVRAFGAHYWLSLPVKVFAADAPIVFALDNERFPDDRRRALQQRSVVLGALPWDAPRIRRILAQARIISREVALGRITFFLDVPSSAIVRP